MAEDKKIEDKKIKEKKELTEEKLKKVDGGVECGGHYCPQCGAFNTFGRKCRFCGHWL